MWRMQPGERWEIMASTSISLKAATTARAVCRCVDCAMIRETYGWRRFYSLRYGVVWQVESSVGCAEHDVTTTMNDLEAPPPLGFTSCCVPRVTWRYPIINCLKHRKPRLSFVQVIIMWVLDLTSSILEYMLIQDTVPKTTP